MVATISNESNDGSSNEKDDASETIELEDDDSKHCTISNESDDGSGNENDDASESIEMKNDKFKNRKTEQF